MSIHNKTIYGTTLWTNYNHRKSNKPLTGPEQFISLQHKLSIKSYPKDNPDVLITHFVSNRKVLQKPWSIGLGPKEILPSSISIFGHIHYPIYGIYENQKVVCNPWGEDPESKVEIVYLD